MNTLIIVAHPSKYGFSHKIAHSYKEAKKKLGDHVKILELYDYEKEIPYLNFSDVRKDFTNNEFIKKCQEDITWSNELVFIFPMWNASEPAILKNWYDITFTARFGFRYTGKLLPEGLLKDKTSKVIVTCDGPSWIYTLIGNPLKTIYKYIKLKQCGIKLKKFIYFDKMRLKSDEEKEKLIKKVELIAIK